MRGSLNSRMVIGASLILAVFVLLTALALERAFEDSARAAVQERLRSQLYLLMGETEVDDNGNILLPASSTLARLNQPHSGLYATVFSQSRPIWSSRSVMGAGYPFVKQLDTGEEHFQHSQQTDQDWFILGYGVVWQTDPRTIPITYSLLEDGQAFQQQIREYRHTLWTWLLAMAALLLTAQLLVLRWGLRPLREVAKDLQAIEQGRQDGLRGNYPAELQGLTGNLNTLLAHERAQQQRYRHALADLAHSLKTPLAILHGSSNQPDTVREQVIRMQKSVDYQLQRAATAGRGGLNSSLDVNAVVNGLLTALHKVHADKVVEVENAIPAGLSLRADKGDMTELLGNLLDNAFKWCRSRVQVRAEKLDTRTLLHVEDDGVGIPTEQAELILTRGVRADESVPGHGIGLAMVRDIVAAYGGELQITDSPLGGAHFIVSLPQ
ncbi:ATP-binding protein [Sulfuriflexus mobilis]|uniref:ATP-binding protein n=1 Tax=Sulfuriflexus mobilis TaxID=1811807 RepID=UPI001E4B433A|nr:ATP-binding protein [Sulfuriflexus mobilis]